MEFCEISIELHLTFTHRKLCDERFSSRFSDLANCCWVNNCVCVHFYYVMKSNFMLIILSRLGKITFDRLIFLAFFVWLLEPILLVQEQEIKF